MHACRSTLEDPTDIAELFHGAGIEAEIVVLENERHATDAAGVAGANHSIVVAAGGDGTVSRVAAGLVDRPAVLGVLPLGTLNHFAKDLCIPLDLKKAVDTIAANHVVGVDVGRVNDRLFLNNSSIGVYPSIIEGREALRRQGRRKWPAMALATVRVLRSYHGVLVSLATNERQVSWRTPFVFVGNNEYALEGIGLGARKTLRGGRLFVYLAPRVRTRQLPMLLAKSLLGRARASGAFEIVSAPALRVDTPRSRTVRVALDGEVVTMTAPLHYRISPGALKVLLPPP